jgi:hypothetical protein
VKHELHTEADFAGFLSNGADHDNNDAAETPSRIVPNLLPFLAADHGNAGRLIALYGDDLRYCHAMKKWIVWDGMRWAVDETDQARRLAKQAMLEFLRQERSRGEVCARLS